MIHRSSMSLTGEQFQFARRVEQAGLASLKRASRKGR